MFATMSQMAIDKYNQKMVMFSIIFLFSTWFLTYFGAVGFIFANCLNMMLRIIHRLVWVFYCIVDLYPFRYQLICRFLYNMLICFQMKKTIWYTTPIYAGSVTFFYFFSLIYIKEYFHDTNLTPLNGLVPSKPVLLAYVIAFILTSSSETMFCCSYGWFWRLCHIATGGVCLLAVALTIYTTEVNLVHFVKKQLLSKLRKKVE